MTITAEQPDTWLKGQRMETENGWNGGEAMILTNTKTGEYRRLSKGADADATARGLGWTDYEVTE